MKVIRQGRKLGSPRSSAYGRGREGGRAGGGHEFRPEPLRHVRAKDFGYDGYHVHVSVIKQHRMKALIIVSRDIEDNIKIDLTGTGLRGEEDLPASG